MEIHILKPTILSVLISVDNVLLKKAPVCGGQPYLAF